MRDNGLAVDAICLSLIYSSPEKDLVYGTSDYCGVDSRYGFLGEFCRLIEESQRGGICVFLDLAFNHGCR